MRKLFIPLLFLSSVAMSQTYKADWQSLDSRPLPQWYKDVKFGIFIHWGVYSVPAFCSKGNYAEWYQHALNSGDKATMAYHKNKFDNISYYKFADQFRAELYQPDEWAKVIEASGARYVVLTSKHHDGFANWPSREASRDWGFPWNAAETGPHRDLLGDLFTAIRKTSIHAGMYYSLYEWYNPLWLHDKPKYVAEHMWPQMQELINTYKPDVFWTDGDWDATDEVWKSKEFLAWLYNESPVKNSIVTNDRWGSGVRFNHGGIYTPEYQPDLDFEDHYWEESRGMGFSYGYNREEDAWDYNSAQVLVLSLIDKVSRGGNFLLDIGPDEHGKIPPVMQERLLQMGDWMNINHEAIYNTVRWRTPSQWSDGKTNYKAKNGGGDIMLKLTVDPDSGYATKECFFTYNPSQNSLYALLPKWPGKKFVIKKLSLTPGTKIELIETHQELSWQQEGANISISLPEFNPSAMKSNYAYVIKINKTGAFASRVKIDVSYPNKSFNPLVTINAESGVDARYTIDGSMPNENSTLYTKPFSVEKSCTLSVCSFKKDILPGNIVSVPLKVFEWHKSVKVSGLEHGLKMSAYKIDNASSVEDMRKLSPVKTAVVDYVSINDTVRAENAGMIYEGYININADGVYHFYVSSDDGSKLFIDGEEVIDNDGSHGDNEKSTSIALKKGYHKIELDYYNGAGVGGLQFNYGMKENEKKKIESFYHIK
ncbi:MAG TPA: alpha-L-fucosidase [Puia sp.]|nr:alpha-L-fucosidase [Puia sp.]